MIFESAWYSQYQDKSMPKYVRLYFCIRREIEKGNIEPSFKLPSIRCVAKELSLSTTTVENAYNQLLVEGYIYSIPQKGYYAAQLDKTFFDINKPVSKEKEFIEPSRMNTEYIDTTLFNFHEWRKLYAQVVADFPQLFFQDGDPQGEFELRKALSDYVYQARGVECNPNQIVVGAGVQTLLHAICDITAGILPPKVAFEEPGFTDVRPVFTNRGYSLYAIALDKSGIRVESLFESRASMCYVSPSHQYPTGLVMPIQNRLELLKWAEQTKGFILEDDYDSELRFEGRPVPSLFSLDKKHRVIYMGSFSTLLAPSIRISYMILPQTLKKLYQEKSQDYRSTVSTQEQLTLALFLKDGFFGRHLRRMRKKCSEKLKVLLSEAEKYHSFINLYSTDTGTFVFMEAKRDAVADNIRLNADQMGVRLTESWERFFVLNYASIPEDKYCNFLMNLMKEG